MGDAIAQDGASTNLLAFDPLSGGDRSFYLLLVCPRSFNLKILLVDRLLVEPVLGDFKVVFLLLPLVNKIGDLEALPAEGLLLDVSDHLLEFFGCKLRQVAV